MEEITANPVTELLGWIKNQDHNIQAEIAFLMSCQHPSFDIYGLPSETNEQIQVFCSKVESSREVKSVILDSLSPFEQFSTSPLSPHAGLSKAGVGINDLCNLFWRAMIQTSRLT